LRGALRLLVLLLAGLPFLTAAASSAPPSRDFWTAGAGAEEPAARASALLEAMSDEELLGQVFMLAYPGDSVPAELYRWVTERGLGGVKIFGWNAEDTDKLAGVIAGLQKTALDSGRGIPLLIATDQEGGLIRHVKGKTSQTPGNMAIGASGRPYDAYWSAYYIGEELASLGITMNFAPAVDLATKPRSSIIGTRAFSEDPIEAAVLGAAYARGMADSGVIPTAKHYPGHGDTEADSHGVLPVIRKSEAALWEHELVPYRVLAAEGIPAIMSGHLNFPLVTGDASPASLSPYFMTKLLRGRIGFQGVAVTDDLFMTGAASGSLYETCLQALEAGNDLLMMSRLLPLDDAVWTRLLRGYRTDPVLRGRIREAAWRVLELKFAQLAPRGKALLVPDPSRLAALLPDPEGAAFFQGQALRGAAALNPGLLPFRHEGRVLVASPREDFLEASREAYPKAERWKFSSRPEQAALPEELAAFESRLARTDRVVVLVTSEAGMDFAQRAREFGKAVGIVSALSPAPLARAGEGDAAVAVFGLSRDCLAAGLAALSGAVKPTGRIPLDLDR
jgi:beta-N-acetylhexosaminidase